MTLSLETVLKRLLVKRLTVLRLLAAPLVRQSLVMVQRGWSETALVRRISSVILLRMVVM